MFFWNCKGFLPHPEDLAVLENTVGIIEEKYHNSTIYIRGDANASSIPRVGNKRDELFNFFLINNCLKSAPLNHHTYHHFMNNGLSDSSIDVLLSAEFTCGGFPNTHQESLLSVSCGKTCPWVESSHDVIISHLIIPQAISQVSTAGNITAPRIHIEKHKVVWSEEGISDYKNLLYHTLPSLQADSLVTS